MTQFMNPQSQFYLPYAARISTYSAQCPLKYQVLPTYVRMYMFR